MTISLCLRRPLKTISFQKKKVKNLFKSFVMQFMIYMRWYHLINTRFNSSLIYFVLWPTRTLSLHSSCVTPCVKTLPIKNHSKFVYECTIFVYISHNFFFRNLLSRKIEVREYFPDELWLQQLMITTKSCNSLVWVDALNGFIETPICSKCESRRLQLHILIRGYYVHITYWPFAYMGFTVF